MPYTLSTGLAATSAAAAEVARDHADRAEQQRRPAGETIAELIRAGYARHFVPLRHDGAAGGFAELLDGLLTLAAADISAAWCAMILATSGRMGGYLPPAGQDELWREGPDAAIAAAFVPTGEVIGGSGGWRLSGQWQMLSAVDHADWALLCGVAAGERRFFAVPRRDFDVLDTWRTVGMRGTGSNTVRLDDAMVPSHRSFAEEDLLAGRNIHSGARCHHVPLLAVAGTLFAAPSVGAVHGALREWSDGIAGLGDPGGRAARADPVAQAVLARCGSELAAAELLLGRAAGTADDSDRPEGFAVRAARDAVFAAELAAQAATRLFRAAGSRAQTEHSRLQRVWRDVAVATSHAALRFERSAAHVARMTWPEKAL
ncbi:hydrolase [Dactylosporangium vinaceum]|uniref:Acyl-CoA dehydrogenase family protein n=1 Tax=Dactylosporangium vinaceum TaxID=53362 RepID=A0ABV5M383_9ACTN|nr:acyl-CoA dehydrogenase family protein [Dactylosporangium vinaceum]UAB99749.1 hydrolase [Dactylosporangium vinaceum]